MRSGRPMQVRPWAGGLAIAGCIRSCYWALSFRQQYDGHVKGSLFICLEGTAIGGTGRPTLRNVVQRPCPIESSVIAG